ncbi:MAG TPA: DNA-deoxyinosine glycosylase [Methylophilaceae bacterium]
MSIVQSFPPVARTDARILILGSMPGKASLAANQYYAHRHNLFWPIMQQLFGVEPTASYEERLATLQSHNIALWDVLKECFRTSSLDGDIVETSIIPNDFATFFAQHQQIRRIFFNGEKAEKAFNRYVLTGLTGMVDITLVRLPSTSPANASIPRARKLQSWQAIVEK